MSRDESLRPWRLAPTVLTLAFLVGVAERSEAQPRPARKVFQDAPAASWIAHPGVPGDAFGVFHFRRVLDLSARPERFVVHVSADNRYRLFVNGQQVSSGPQRSDLMHWRYETVDLAPFLRDGRNVLAALVWNWGAERPVAQFSSHTGLLVQGDSEREAVANTGPEWKVLNDSGYQPVPVRLQTYYASPPGEEVDGSKYPWGWQEANYSDESWVAAAGVAGGRARTQLRGTAATGEGGAWQLVPRSIPAMEENPVRFARVRRAEGVTASDAFLGGQSALTVPPRTHAVLLLDQSHLTNAYAVIETSGGSGSTIGLTYAEALVDAAGKKGNRNDIEGKTIVGIKDVFRPDGGDHRRLQTLWFRTYRYVQAEIETGDQPLRIDDLHGIFTAYPFELRARFDSDLPWLADLWQIDWRGARLCAFETYFDTPYYEQLQYVGDTRIQALISLYMTGDDRLVRQAISHFDLSRIPDGITASRYPSSLGQYIPTFSLLWVAMVHDYWMHRDDPAFVRDLLPGRAQRRRLVRAPASTSTGLLGPIPWWPYVDWAPEWPLGVPPAGAGWALDDDHPPVRLRPRPSGRARGRARARGRGRARPGGSLRRCAPRCGLGRGIPHGGCSATLRIPRSYSQQTNIMAVLVDAVPAAEQRASWSACSRTRRSPRRPTTTASTSSRPS